jgi:hypothetical protein
VVLGVGIGAVGIGGAVLPLEADGPVGKQVAGERVAGSRDGEANDDSCVSGEYNDSRTGEGAFAAAHRGATTRPEPAWLDGGDAARRCAL